MLDNGTTECNYDVPTQFHDSIRNREPYEIRNIIFIPKYNKFGEFVGYEGRLKNLLFRVFHNRILMYNSLHKFWHGNNYNDFYACEIEHAVEYVSDATGIDWKKGTVKKIEYGCNIETNASQAVDSLKYFKIKGYQPMTKYGTVYGASCDYREYGMKGYNKSFEVLQDEKIRLHKSIFRWEVYISKMRALEKLIGIPLTVEQLIKKDTLRKLADDAIAKYKATIKLQQINLHKLSVHEQLVYAAMQLSSVRNNLRHHHKETFKKHKRLYKQFMNNPDVVSNENLEGLLIEKFDELINGIPTCSIVGKEGTIIPHIN